MVLCLYISSHLLQFILKEDVSDEDRNHMNHTQSLRTFQITSAYARIALQDCIVQHGLHTYCFDICAMIILPYE